MESHKVAPHWCLTLNRTLEHDIGAPTVEPHSGTSVGNFAIRVYIAAAESTVESTVEPALESIMERFL